MKFTYSIEEEDFESLFHTIRVLNATDKEFKIGIIILIIAITFLGYQVLSYDHSIIGFFVTLLLFLGFNKFFHKYIKKKSISNMKEMVKGEFEVEFFDNYFVSKNSKSETKTSPKEYTFFIVGDLLFYYSNSFLVHIIKLKGDNEKQFVIQWFKNNNVKLLLVEKADIISYDIKKTYKKNYYLMTILGFLYLIGDFLSFDWFGYYLNSIFKLCEINNTDSFPCYGLYDIYAVIFSIILIIITIILFIKNIVLLKNPLVIKK